MMPWDSPWWRGHAAMLRSRGGTEPYEMHSESALQTMAQVPILGIVGPNGSGKSLLAALLCMRSLATGRRVLSTVRLLDWEYPRPCPGGADCDDPDSHEVDGVVHGAPHPLYVRWTRWGQVRDMGRRYDVWADEVTGVGNSRDSSGLPKMAQNLVVQLRRDDAVLRWTAPAMSRADVLFREVTQGIVASEGYMSWTDVESGRLWPKRRLFRWRLYDAKNLPPDPTWHQLIESGSIDRTWYWGPGSPAFGAYDSFAPVSTVGRVTATGVCEVCEGTRRRHECVCSEYQAEKAGARSARSGGPTQWGADRDDGHGHAASISTLPRRVAVEQ